MGEALHNFQMVNMFYTIENNEIIRMYTSSLDGTGEMCSIRKIIWHTYNNIIYILK